MKAQSTLQNEPLGVNQEHAELERKKAAEQRRLTDIAIRSQYALDRRLADQALRAGERTLRGTITW